MFNLNPRYKTSFILALGIWLVYLFVLASSDLASIPDLKLKDFFCQKATRQESRFSNEVIIVAIDDQSMHELNSPWPCKRALFAKFLDRMKDEKASIICLDLLFIHPSNAGESDDVELARAIRSCGNVILGGFINSSKVYLKPYYMFREAARHVGFVNRPRDRDAFIRRSRLVQYIEGKPEFSIDIKVLAEYFNIPLDNIILKKDSLILAGAFSPHTIVPQDPDNSSETHTERPPGPDKDGYFTDSLVIPVLPDGTFQINYRLDHCRFKTIRLSDVIFGKYEKGIFKDKVVIVGTFSEVLQDVHPTPVGIVPGALIIAQSISTIISRKFISHVPSWVNSLIVLALLLTAVFTVQSFRFLTGSALYILTLLLYFYLGRYLYTKDIWIEIIPQIALGAFCFGTCVALRHATTLIENIQLQRLAITDGLTGVFVHRYFQVRLEEELKRARRYKRPLSLIMCDIDHFKKINDTFGHQQGDTVLKEVAEILKKTARQTDYVARYGGEEFAVILTETDQEGASKLAERIRQMVEAHEFPGQPFPLRVTLSLGVATYRETDSADARELIKRADLALYRSKSGGRNRVTVASDGLQSPSAEGLQV